jgi:hypothetical protein
MFTASCGRTRMTAGPPLSRGLVLSVPAPTIAAGYTMGRVQGNRAAVAMIRATQSARPDLNH